MGSVASIGFGYTEARFTAVHEDNAGTAYARVLSRAAHRGLRSATFHVPPCRSNTLVARMRPWASPATMTSVHVTVACAHVHVRNEHYAISNSYRSSGLDDCGDGSQCPLLGVTQRSWS